MKKSFLMGMAAWTLLAACAGQQAQSDEPVHSVMVVQPAGAASEVQKTFSGIVEEGREIGVAFKTGGQLARVLVKEGDLVREGQLIAVLDDKDYKLGADAARIQYEQMQRELGITFVYVTHDQEEALSMSDKIVVMDHGEIQHIGTPKDIYQRPANLFVASFIGRTNLVNAKLVVEDGKGFVVFADGYKAEMTNIRPEEQHDQDVVVAVRPEELIVNL